MSYEAIGSPSDQARRKNDYMAAPVMIPEFTLANHSMMSSSFQNGHTKSESSDRIPTTSFDDDDLHRLVGFRGYILFSIKKVDVDVMENVSELVVGTEGGRTLVTRFMP